MRKQRGVLALTLLALWGTSAMAQEPVGPPPAVAPAGPPPAAQGTVRTPIGPVRVGQRIPLDIRIVVGKYQGEKRVSSVPYMLAVNALAGGNLDRVEQTQLTIGSDVPVPTTTFTPAGDGKAGTQPLRSYNYRNVGTVISAGAIPADEERFELALSIDESSVGTSVQGAGTETMPVFKSFKTRNRLLLRGGQTREFTAATDRVNGETVRIEVTLTVAK